MESNSKKQKDWTTSISEEREKNKKELLLEKNKENNREQFEKLYEDILQVYNEIVKSPIMKYFCMDSKYFKVDKFGDTIHIGEIPKVDNLLDYEQRSVLVFENTGRKNRVTTHYDDSRLLSSVSSLQDRYGLSEILQGLHARKLCIGETTSEELDEHNPSYYIPDLDIPFPDLTKKEIHNIFQIFFENPSNKNGPVMMADRYIWYFQKYKNLIKEKKPDLDSSLNRNLTESFLRYTTLVIITIILLIIFLY